MENQKFCNCEIPKPRTQFTELHEPYQMCVKCGLDTEKWITEIHLGTIHYSDGTVRLPEDYEE